VNTIPVLFPLTFADLPNTASISLTLEDVRSMQSVDRSATLFYVMLHAMEDVLVTPLQALAHHNRMQFQQSQETRAALCLPEDEQLPIKNTRKRKMADRPFTHRRHLVEWGFVTWHWLHAHTAWPITLRESDCVLEMPSWPLHRFFSIYPVDAHAITEPYKRDFLVAALDQRLRACHGAGRRRIEPDTHGFAYLQTLQDIEDDRASFEAACWTVAHMHTLCPHLLADDTRAAVHNWMVREETLFSFRLRHVTCTHRLRDMLSDHPHYFIATRLEITEHAHWGTLQGFVGTFEPGERIFVCCAFEHAATALASRRVILERGYAIFPFSLCIGALLQTFSERLRACTARIRRKKHPPFPLSTQLMQLCEQYRTSASVAFLPHDAVTLPTTSLPELLEDAPQCVSFVAQQLGSGTPQSHLRYTQRSVAFTLVLNLGAQVEDIEDLVSQGARSIYGSASAASEARSMKASVRSLVRGGYTSYRHSCSKVMAAQLCPYMRAAGSEDEAKGACARSLYSAQQAKAKQHNIHNASIRTFNKVFRPSFYVEQMKKITS